MCERFYGETCITGALVQVENRNFLASRSWHIVPKAGNVQLAQLGSHGMLTSKGRSRRFLRDSSGHWRQNVISILWIGQVLDPLIDGTSEALEREGIDEGVVRRCGVRFRAGLEGWIQP